MPLYALFLASSLALHWEPSAERPRALSFGTRFHSPGYSSGERTSTKRATTSAEMFLMPWDSFPIDHEMGAGAGRKVNHQTNGGKINSNSVELIGKFRQVSNLR